MRKNPFYNRGLVWALAAFMAAAAPGTSRLHAAAKQSNAALLASELPRGETLASAPMKDVEAAVRAAVAKRPTAASEIVRIAILAKTPKQRAVSCRDVRLIVSAAVASVPSEAREVSEMAMSLAPDCGEEITQVLGTPVGNNASGVAAGTAVPGSTTSTTGDAGDTGNANGFGAGFGPGFPGSPGFSGSAPSGASAVTSGFPLPTPSPTPVTSTVNS